MNRKGKRNFKLAMIGIVALVSVVLFSDYDFDFGNKDGVSFSIPVPDELQSFVGQTASNSNASILCSVKQTTTAIDSTGHIIQAINSKLLQGNPLLSLSSTSGVK